MDYSLAHLQSYRSMKGVDAAAEIFADAIMARRKMVCLGDFDADGATSSALAICGLQALGATDPDFIVPNRFTMGYGMSPLLADMAAEAGADVVFTVDNGISSLAGVAHARRLGQTVVVTDHHLPGVDLPAADAIVNPNQGGCGFPSRHLTGVGVMFYVLCATRQKLKVAGWFDGREPPALSDLLDLVALGTIGDVARLDYNNRILVENGLRRLRAGRARPGIQALMAVAGVQSAFCTSQDIGFRLTPRVNAAGRLDDMRVGIQCLLAPTVEAALPLANTLDRLNRDRRDIEGDMLEDATMLTEGVDTSGIVLYRDSFHQGVVGLVAGRVKEARHRPTIVFAPSSDTEMKGSGRSIPGFHLRDALAAIESRHPGLILRYGGHAAACGCTIEREKFESFRAAFIDFCDDTLTQDQLERVLLTDGELDPSEITLEHAVAIERAGPWGQGFEEPLFEGTFRVELSRLIGDGKHVQYTLRAGNQTFRAVHFGAGEAPAAVGDALQCVYRMTVNRFRGNENVDLQLVEAL